MPSGAVPLTLATNDETLARDERAISCGIRAANLASVQTVGGIKAAKAWRGDDASIHSRRWDV